MTTFIHITFILSLLNLVLFITLVLMSIFHNAKERKERMSFLGNVKRVVNFGKIKDADYWKSFKPGECVIFNGYLSRDGCGLQFYNKEPKKGINRNSHFYFVPDRGDDETDMPQFMQDAIQTPKASEVRKVSIKVVVSEDTIDVENIS